MEQLQLIIIQYNILNILANAHRLHFWLSFPDTPPQDATVITDNCKGRQRSVSWLYSVKV